MRIAYNIAAAKTSQTVIYVNVGQLPKSKAEQYIKDLMTKSGPWGIGKVWIPNRREDGNAKTEVVLVPGQPSQEEVLAVYRELRKA